MSLAEVIKQASGVIHNVSRKCFLKVYIRMPTSGRFSLSRAFFMQTDS